MHRLRDKSLTINRLFTNYYQLLYYSNYPIRLCLLKHLLQRNTLALRANDKLNYENRFHKFCSYIVYIIIMYI